MRTLTLFAVAATAGLFGSAARAEETPDYAKLLVGKWEATKADEGTVPVGSVIEFTKDGKLKLTAKKGGEEATIDGTYKVEKDGFTLSLKVGEAERKQRITVTKASDKELSTKDEAGKVVVLTRVK